MVISASTRGTEHADAVTPPDLQDPVILRSKQLNQHDMLYSAFF